MAGLGIEDGSPDSSSTKTVVAPAVTVTMSSLGVAVSVSSFQSEVTSKEGSEILSVSRYGSVPLLNLGGNDPCAEESPACRAIPNPIIADERYIAVAHTYRNQGSKGERDGSKKKKKKR